MKTNPYFDWPSESSFKQKIHDFFSSLKKSSVSSEYPSYNYNSDDQMSYANRIMLDYPSVLQSNCYHFSIILVLKWTLEFSRISQVLAKSFFINTRLAGVSVQYKYIAIVEFKKFIAMSCVNYTSLFFWIFWSLPTVTFISISYSSEKLTILFKMCTVQAQSKLHDTSFFDDDDQLNVDLLTQATIFESMSSFFFGNSQSGQFFA